MTNDDSPAAGSTDARTERASRANLLTQVEELERDNAFLKERLEIYRERLDIANTRMLSMGRVARTWMLVRATVRRPWNARRFPRELVRILRDPVDPALPRRPERQTTEEIAAARAQGARAENERRFAARTAAIRPAAQVTDARRRLRDVRVAAIADEWLLDALEPECRLVVLDPDRWEAQLSNEPPDMLLIQSAERGRASAWQYRVAWSAYPESVGRSALVGISSWCVTRSIPRVLWDTERHERWARFRSIAGLVDHVFAADAASAAAYDSLATSTAVSADHLPIGIQPLRHNPSVGVAPERLSRRPAFIGQVDLDIGLDRREAVERLLRAGMTRDMVVHDLAGPSDPARHRMPSNVAAAVVSVGGPGLRAEVARQHPVVLLEGSGSRPGAVVPRLILEAVACGVPVVTTRSHAVADMLSEVPFQGDTVEELVAAIDAASSSTARAQAETVGVAEVMARHTIGQRLATIAATVGLAVDPSVPRVSAVALADEWADGSTLATVIAALGSGVSDVVVGAAAIDEAASLRSAVATAVPQIPVRGVAVDEALSRSDRLRRAALGVDSEWVAIVAPEPIDSATTLRDWVTRTTFVDADAIGWPCDAASGDHPADAIESSSAVVRRASLVAHGWPNGTSDEAFARWRSAGLRLHGFRPSDAGRQVAPGPATP